MSEFTPHFAPVVVLLFLGSILLCGISFVVLVYGVVYKSPKILRIGGPTLVTVVSGYFFLLVGVSLASSKKVLPYGSSKYFCEIDCHLAYSVIGVGKAPYIDWRTRPASNFGLFVVVQLQTRFDPNTISPRRGDAALTPNARAVVLVDDEGHSFPLSKKGMDAIARQDLPSSTLTTSLRPGEWYISYLVFEVPDDVQGLRLLITEDKEIDPETLLIIGHENSLFHKKIYLDLSSAPPLRKVHVPDLPL
jgi:hypothetical protein